MLVTQSCPTLCDPTDCSLPGSSVHGVLQARTLKWVAISFCKAHKCSPNNKGTLKKKAPLDLQACGCVSVRMAASRTPPYLSILPLRVYSGWPKTSFLRKIMPMNEEDTHLQVRNTRKNCLYRL